MAQVSRPFQVGLAAVAVLAAVWLVALRGHSGSGSGSGGSAATVQQQPPHPSRPASTSTSPYRGSAPGVAGLTRAIEKARGAVALSERNARQLQRKSAQASSSSSAASNRAVTGSAPAASSAASRAAPASGAAPSSRTRTTPTHRPTASHGPAAPAAGRSVPALQAQVETQLKAGKIVAILFWNPHAEVDQVVRSELAAAQRALRGQLAVELAQASQVGEFGPFTHAVQVLQTPTILFANRRGQTSAVTGLTDSFSLQQAVSEARR
jgi:hypothetical protein